MKLLMLLAYASACAMRGYDTKTTVIDPYPRYLSHVSHTGSPSVTGTSSHSQSGSPSPSHSHSHTRPVMPSRRSKTPTPSRSHTRSRSKTHKPRK